MFRNLSEREKQSILSQLSAKEKSYAKGELIFRYEGNQAVVGMLVAGRGQVLRYDESHRKMVLEWLQPGDVFGEALSFSCGFEKEEETFIVCDCPTKVLFLDYEKLTSINHPVFLANWNAILSKKLRTFGRRLEVLSCRSIREKLNCYFSLLAKEQGSRHIENPYNMTLLADYLSVDRSAMVRELRTMQEIGLIKMEKKDVILL